VLPLAVAVFRWTGPAMNFAVAIYVAHWFGIELSAGQIAAGWAMKDAQYDLGIAYFRGRGIAAKAFAASTSRRSMSPGWVRNSASRTAL